MPNSMYKKLSVKQNKKNEIKLRLKYLITNFENDLKLPVHRFATMWQTMEYL